MPCHGVMAVRARVRSMTAFGPRIQSRRNRLGLTLRDVESITDGAISNAYLSQLERGKIKNPSGKTLLSLAAAYHVDPSEMLEWLGEPTTIKPPPICPTCGRARIGETWMERLGVVIDSASDTDRSGEADETAKQAQPKARAGAEGIAQPKVQP